MACPVQFEQPLSPPRTGNLCNANRYCKSRPDTEDLTQDVFLTLWEQRERITLQGKFFSYVYRVARSLTRIYLQYQDVSPISFPSFDELRESALQASGNQLCEKEVGAMEDALLSTPGQLYCGGEFLQQFSIWPRSMLTLSMTPLLPGFGEQCMFLGYPTPKT